MPREIDCLDCGGRGEIITADRSSYPPSEEFIKCFNPNCKNGKIKVYTESELNKAVKQEREEILNIFDNYKDERDFYTWDEVQEAIRQRGNE